MSRSDIPEKDREDFCLYVDEFQNFSTESFATIMSEARKFRLNLIVANQFTTQLSDEIRDAVFGNMGTVVSYRIGQNDVEALSRYFQPLFDAEDLLRVPNFNSIVRTLVGGVPTQPFSMAAIEPLGSPNEELGRALKQLSAAKHGRPKAMVEKEIYERLATKPPERPKFGPQQGFGSPTPSAGKPMPKPGGSSFLDDWLAKGATTKVTVSFCLVEPHRNHLRLLAVSLLLMLNRLLLGSTASSNESIRRLKITPQHLLRCSSHPRKKAR